MRADDDQSAAGAGRQGERRSDADVGPDRLSLDAYLRGAQGFLVDTTHGREVGVVDEVVVDEATELVVQIEVCSGWFGRTRRIIEPRDVVAVDPGLRRLVVSPSVLSDERR